MKQHFLLLIPFTFFLTLTSAFAQQKVKTKKFYLDGRLYREINFDSLGREVSEWQHSVKMPLETKNKVVYTEYANDGSGYIRKTLNAKLKDNGKIVFSNPNTSGEVTYSVQKPGVINSEKTTVYIFLNTSKLTYDLKEAWNLPYREGSKLIAFDPIISRIDTSKFFSEYFEYSNWYSTYRYNYYDSINHSLVVQIDSTERNGCCNSYTRVVFNESEYSKEYCLHNREDAKQDYCTIKKAILTEDGRPFSEYFFKKGRSIEDSIENPDFEIEYDYTNPTVEKQLIRKGRKSYIHLIRTEFHNNLK